MGWIYDFLLLAVRYGVWYREGAFLFPSPPGFSSRALSHTRGPLECTFSSSLECVVKRGKEMEGGNDLDLTSLVLAQAP